MKPYYLIIVIALSILVSCRNGDFVSEDDYQIQVLKVDSLQRTVDSLVNVPEVVACFDMTFTPSEDDGDVVAFDDITFSNCSENALGFVWDFDDGTVTTLDEPTHFYTKAGTYYIRLTALGSNSSVVLVDTLVVDYTIGQLLISRWSLDSQTDCDNVTTVVEDDDLFLTFYEDGTVFNGEIEEEDDTWSLSGTTLTINPSDVDAEVFNITIDEEELHLTQTTGDCPLTYNLTRVTEILETE